MVHELVVALGAAFRLGSRRAGLSAATAVELGPVVALCHFVTLWSRADNTIRRIGWLLAAEQQRRRGEVWAALADLLPEHVIADLSRGEPAPPARAGRAAVLFADLVGYTARWHQLQVRGGLRGRLV